MYIGIDCGTQGTKAIICDSDSKVIGTGYYQHDLISNDYGKKEQKTNWWIDAMVKAIKQAFSQAAINPKEIKGLGISGQQHGLVLLDETDRVLRNVKLWCDTEPTELFQQFEEQHFSQTQLVDQLGIHTPVAFTIAKLLWIKTYEPELYSKIHKVMLPHDYLNYWFTGEFKTECGDASGSGFLDTHTRCWSDAILDVFDKQRSFVLPELIESHEPHGFVRPEIAKLFGFDANVIVSSGGGDNMMAAIGTGNVTDGLLTMSLGTSGTVYSHSSVQVDSKNHPDINAFCSSTNGYLPLASTMNVTSATTAFRELFELDLNCFEEHIASSPVGADGIRIMPYLNGARLPNVPRARAAIFGLSGNNMNQQNLLRSAVEGVTYNLAKGVEILKDSGLSFEHVLVIGGGSNSRTWRQIIADVTGLEVKAPQAAEAGALGAAMQAMWCESVYYNKGESIEDICQRSIVLDEDKRTEPNPASVATYQQLFSEYHGEVNDYIKMYR
ncbi:xylulokinase [Photobacterium sagamiensis]|uniref:xylulokinase n=1 Tax=Photobacterium sagamiensis TaxID=2910241 RepID=UPI003D0F5E0F